MLTWLATSQGTAVLTAAGIIVSALALLTTTSAKWLSSLGPIFFSLLSWLAWQQKRRIIAIAGVIVFLFSLTLAIRSYVAPHLTRFEYSGDLMDTSMTPYKEESGIPLTLKPVRGTVDEHFYEGTGDYYAFDVSCTRWGIYRHAGQSFPVLWAHMVSGDYRTYWVPVSFLGGLAPGSARELLPCSDWRWELHDLL